MNTSFTEGVMHPSRDRSSLGRRIRRIRRSGAAALEFSLTLPLLLMLLAAVIDYGDYMNKRVVVARAVMEGARSGAAVFEQPSVALGSSISDRAKARTLDVLQDLGMECKSSICNTQAAFCSTTSNSNGCDTPPFQAVIVRVTWNYEPFFGLVPVPDQISESFIMAVEHQRPGLE